MTHREEGNLASVDGTKLYWLMDRPKQDPKAYVVVVHGYGDHSGRYQQPIAAFLRAGFGVAALDYRGHGKAEGRRSDVMHWSAYVDDLEVFLKHVTERVKGAPLFVVAHSHGGLIATHFAASRKHQLKGLVLTAPFYALGFEPPAIQVALARLVKKVLPGLYLSSNLRVEDLSRDEAWQQETQKDVLYEHKTTPRWFFEVSAAQAQLTGMGAKVTLPLLMLTGEADAIASTPAAKAFFDTVASSDKSYHGYPDFRHEVLMEIGKEEVWARIIQWISSRL